MRRRRSSRRAPRALIPRRVSLALIAAVLGAVVLINGAVRWSGGNPSWLSPWFLAERSAALAALAWHTRWHVLALMPTVLQPASLPDELGCRASAATLRRAVVEAARREGVPPSFLLAIARTESELAPHAISRAGAMGLMQLMPDTAAQLEVRDPFDPRASAAGSARYMAALLRRYGGDRLRAAAAYNAGPGAIPVHGRVELPGETRIYVARVLEGRRGAGQPITGKVRSP